MRSQKSEVRSQTEASRLIIHTLRPPTSDLRPLTSDLRPPTSDLRPLTSDLCPLSPDLRPLQNVHHFLAETAARALPRILTQICRDPGAPFFGACDRNWWHYKIRDFPSIILQQAGYTLALAAKTGWDSQPQSSGWDLQSQTVAGTSCPQQSPDLRPSTFDLRPLAAATACFWNTRALKHGAFEEYYPYEQGYPPVAFATLAVAKLCHMGVVPLADIRPGLAIAAKQLLTRFEAQAANQQIAGTAALSVIRTIAPDLIEEATFQDILTRILALQHDEGWFPEYDGPDLGYLAVSIDCLYDIHDHTADPRILPAIRKAADFIAWFALSPIGGAGMHNSRNTDYITPYGLVRLALEENDPEIVRTVEKLFTRTLAEVRSQRSEVGDQKPSDSSPLPLKTENFNLANSYHPLDAIDDRYWCHYIGHSVIRALLLLKNRSWDLQSQSVAGTSCPQQIPPTFDLRPSTTVQSHPGSGHTLLTSPTSDLRPPISDLRPPTSAHRNTALISTRKGGILTAVWPDGATASDFGWLVQTPKNLLVTHWWSTDWQIEITDTHATTKGWLVPHKEHTSEPWKHILLRIASFVLGRRLIKILKRLVIFKKPLQSHHFTRTVTWENDTLVVTDTLTGLAENHTLTRAPRTSKRHVASADSYHPEDLVLLSGIERTENIERKGDTFTCESRYQKSEIRGRRSEVSL